jgi:hypothetical protein
MRSEGSVVIRGRWLLLLLALGLIALALFVPTLREDDRTKAVAPYGAWPVGPAWAIEPNIARIFGCTLDETPREAHCMSPRTRGRVSLDIDPMHGNAIRFTAMVVITHDDFPRPVEERQSTDTTMRFMDYFFPRWTERRQWMSLALQQARDRHANSAIELGDTAVSVNFEVPQGGAAPSTFAFITIEPMVRC